MTYNAKILVFFTLFLEAVLTAKFQFSNTKITMKYWSSRLSDHEGHGHNALVAGNGSYIVRPCGHDLHGPTQTNPFTHRHPDSNPTKFQTHITNISR